MKNTLLGVIAVCLFMITLKLYVPEANAEVAGVDMYELVNDSVFNYAVRSIVEHDCVTDRVRAKTTPLGSAIKHQHEISCLQ